MMRICLAVLALAFVASDVKAQGCNGYQAGQRRTLLPRSQSNGCNGFQAGTQQFTVSNGCSGGFAMGPRTFTTFQSNGCNGGFAGRQSFTPVQTATGVQMVPVNPAPAATAPAATATAPAATAPAVTTAPGVVSGFFVQTAEPPLAGSVVTGTAFTEEIVTVPRGRRAILPWNRR